MSEILFDFFFYGAMLLVGCIVYILTVEVDKRQKATTRKACWKQFRTKGGVLGSMLITIGIIGITSDHIFPKPTSLLHVLLEIAAVFLFASITEWLLSVLKWMTKK